MKIFRKKPKPPTTESTPPDGTIEPVVQTARRVKPVEYEFAPNDPFLHHLVSSPGVVQIEKLDLNSPALEFLKNVGVKVSIPLVSQGELIGLLNLGPRMSEQDYSSDDYRLLNTLATQAAPALRVAQLAHQAQIEAAERERIEGELRVARVIQETLLPKEIPVLDNWHLDALWQPAREVSGDFYDFLEFPDGRLGIITGDVTGKGVPAALVMATTRTILRATAERVVNPGQVLERANNLLCPDIPRNMFVTCLYLLLDPRSGKILFANAGHNLPQKCNSRGAIELRATGMPLGLMVEMTYEETEAELEPGESLLLYSDGLVEAHNPEGEMFGFPRLHNLITANRECSDQISALMEELVRFTGPAWEQEDDVTFVAIRRLQTLHPLGEQENQPGDAQTILEFSLASQPGNERMAMERVAQAAEAAGFPEQRLEKLKTAVAETTLNAIEHGNQYDPDRPATIRLTKAKDRFTIFITDQGGGNPIPETPQPDLDAKLAGLQSPRGWGLFLIKSMVDEMIIHTSPEHHTVELVFTTLEETGFPGESL